MHRRSIAGWGDFNGLANAQRGATPLHSAYGAYEPPRAGLGPSRTFLGANELVQWEVERRPACNGAGDARSLMPGQTPENALHRNGAIVYDELSSVEDVPSGWTDSQDGGTYLLTRYSGKALFGYLDDARSL